MEQPDGQVRLKDWAWLAVVFLVALAGNLYASLDGLPLSHPGNVKAADPFYHVAVVQGILETAQWGYYPSWVSYGVERASNSQPPLLYMQSAGLSLLSGVPAWVSIYFFVSLVVALGVAVTYLLAKEVFDHDGLALVASAAMVLPVPIRVWLYGVYIGLWIQVVTYVFIVLGVWLGLRYRAERRIWQVFGISLVVVMAMLMHPQDLLALFVPFAYVAWLAWSAGVWRERVRHLAALVIAPLVVFVLLIPRFLFVWGSAGGGYSPGWYGVRSFFFSDEYLGGLVYPGVSFFPWFVLSLLALGAVFLFLRRQKYPAWLSIIAYFVLVTYVSPIFLQSPSYLVRMRAMMPLFVYPVAAFGLMHIIEPVRRLVKAPAALFLILVAGGLIWGSYGSYDDLKSGISGEHVSFEKWRAFERIRSISDERAKVLFLSGGYQASPTLLERRSAVVEIPEWQRVMQFFLANNGSFPDSFTVEWSSETLRHTHKYHKSFFTFGDYPEWERQASLDEFDFIYMEHLSEQMMNVNNALVQVLQSRGWEPVFLEGRSVVLKNPSPLPDRREVAS